VEFQAAFLKKHIVLISGSHGGEIGDESLQGYSAV
jgi:hypothetical protein